MTAIGGIDGVFRLMSRGSSDANDRVTLGIMRKINVSYVFETVLVNVFLLIKSRNLQNRSNIYANSRGESAFSQARLLKSNFHPALCLPLCFLFLVLKVRNFPGVSESFILSRGRYGRS